jgi:DNA-binding MarR family transcriptional regulator
VVAKHRAQPQLAGSGRIASRLARHVETTLADMGLTVAQYRVLVRLAEGSLGATDLASTLSVAPSSLTSVVDGLVGRGLIARRADPSDRRRVVHLLNDSGRRKLVACDKALERRIYDILSHVQAEQARLAASGLEAFGVALEAFRAFRTAGP